MSSRREWEREAIGERTRAALRHKRSQGQRTGNIPYGSRLAGDGTHLEPDPTEQESVEQIRELRKQGASLRRFNASVEPHSLIDWIDDRLAKEWGPHAAARAWNIVTNGYDGDVEQAHGRKPHELPIRSTLAVPGSGAPVKNLFHVSQALSWIAGTRNTIPERLEYVKAIPRLMEPLTAAVV